MFLGRSCLTERAGDESFSSLTPWRTLHISAQSKKAENQQQQTQQTQYSTHRKDLGSACSQWQEAGMWTDMRLQMKEKNEASDAAWGKEPNNCVSIFPGWCWSFTGSGVISCHFLGHCPLSMWPWIHQLHRTGTVQLCPSLDHRHLPEHLAYGCSTNRCWMKKLDKSLHCYRFSLNFLIYRMKIIMTVLPSSWDW